VACPGRNQVFELIYWAHSIKACANTSKLSPDMHDHAQHVLGVPVIFNTAVVWDRLAPLPDTSQRTRTSVTETKGCATMLLPHGSELFSIYIDERQGMFVQAQGCSNSLFVLDSRWGGLRSVLPADSACLAVVYRARNEKLMLGVYDVLRVAASDKSQLPVFERQKILYELFLKAPPMDAIERHWVGLEESLLQYMKCNGNLQKIHFDVSYMLRLAPAACAPDHEHEQRTRQSYELVLRPLTL
jgi:hypothetical protein